MIASEAERWLQAAGYRTEQVANGRLISAACKCGATVHRVIVPCHPLTIRDTLDYLADCLICGRAVNE